MTVAKLISLLQTMPPKAQVMLWEGFNREFVPTFDIDENVAERLYIPRRKNKIDSFEKSTIGQWEDHVQFIDEQYIQRKQIVCIQPKFKGQKWVEGLR